MGLLEKVWLISLPLGRDGLRAWFSQVSLQSVRFFVDVWAGIQLRWHQWRSRDVFPLPVSLPLLCLPSDLLHYTCIPVIFLRGSWEYMEMWNVLLALSASPALAKLRIQPDLGLNSFTNSFLLQYRSLEELIISRY